MGFPDSSVGKESACNAEDCSSIPGLGRTAGEGIGYPCDSQSCLTLCDPMDCSLPGSSTHGISQARILEWVAISFSRGSSQPWDWTLVSRIVVRHFTVWANRGVTLHSSIPIIQTLQFFENSTCQPECDWLSPSLPEWFHVSAGSSNRDYIRGFQYSAVYLGHVNFGRS